MNLHILILSYLSIHQALAWEGLSRFAKPKYTAKMQHFEYVHPNPPKGGTITIGLVGSFDTLNPFSLKGQAPLYLRDFVFQQFGQRSLDEVDTRYPELSSNFRLSKDRKTLYLKIRDNVHFSNGQKLSSKDFKFSFALFRSKQVSALYHTYWADINKITNAKPPWDLALDLKAENKELPNIALEMYVLPSSTYQIENFGKKYIHTAIGSGPYQVHDYKMGSFIHYKQNPKFWGWNSPLYRGRYNFENVIVKYYKDASTAIEGFKKGDFDIYFCFYAKVWEKSFQGKKFANKTIIKDLWHHQNSSGTQGFFFNLRKNIFQDIKVRKAIALALDFSWINKTLFYNQYRLNDSIFENSIFDADHLPNTDEQEIINELQAELPPEIYQAASQQAPGSLGEKLKINKRLKLARKLLKEAGYNSKNGTMHHKDGKKLDFPFLIRSQAMARVVEAFAQRLQQIGVKVTPQIKDDSVYIKKIQNRDYHMFATALGQSLSPGNEQRDYWSSSAAKDNYSSNYSGISNNAIDIVIEKLIAANSRTEQETYAQVLDRLIYHFHIMVPNWHSPHYRVAYWNKISRKPGEVPPYIQAYNIELLYPTPIKK